jgi:hypothetical protein
LSIGVLALLAGALFCFSVPAWDDFVRATGPLQGGWWHYVIGLVYFHWQGRWASCGLESAVLPRLDITRLYPLLIAMVAMVDVLGAYVLCRWFTGKSSRWTSLGLTVCLLALLWAGLPSLAEAVYWFVGAVENTMVLSLAAILLVGVIELSTWSRRSPIVLAVGTVLLCAAAVVICGFHELYGAMLCLALATGTVWAFYTPSMNRFVWVMVTLSAVVGLAIVVMAPGNSHRLAVDGGSHGRHFGYDLRIAAVQVVSFIPRWLFNPRLLAASIWVALSPTLAGQHRNNSESAAAFPWRWVLFIVWLIMLAIGFFAPSWAFGTRMPPRTLSGVYIVFVVGWLVNVYVWSASGWMKQLRLGNWSLAIRRTACAVLAITLLAIGNVPAAIHDFHDRVPAWHVAVERRFALLRNQAGEDAVVPELPTRSPTLLLSGEVSSDPQDYRNWGMVNIFKLRSLRLIPSSGPIAAPPEYPTRAPGGGSGT